MIDHRGPVAARGGIGNSTEGERVAAAAAVPSSRFELDGHALIAVRRPPRGQKKAGWAAESLAGTRAVGRITFSGKHYLVFDARHAPVFVDAGTSVAEILTRRELQVALLIGDGKCDKEIARQLGISGYTVREHIRRIFAKLHIGRRSAIVACVMR
jgi:DNA-binding CsgD family transcriptional regulator